MTRIDRYLLFLYVRVLLICFSSVCGLLIVVLVFSNLDEFVRFAEIESKTLLVVLLDYYGPYTLSIFEQMSGLMPLLAFLFTVAWLHRTREFTALLAAGITKRRIMRPLMMASAAVILLALGLREVAIPRLQDSLDRTPQDLTGDAQRIVRPRFDARAVTLIRGSNLLPQKRRVLGPELQIEGGAIHQAVGGVIVGTQATYLTGRDGRPTGYLLEGVTNPQKIDRIPSVYHARDGQPLLLTAWDIDWIEPGSCFLVSDVTFDMLRSGNDWKKYVSTSDLIRHLREQTNRSGNDVRVMIHQRLLRPAIDWTVLLLGLPVLLGRADRNLFVAAGLCVGIVVFFTGILMAAGQVLEPSNAVWIPLLIFFPWAWAKTQTALDC